MRAAKRRKVLSTPPLKAITAEPMSRREDSNASHFAFAGPDGMDVSVASAKERTFHLGEIRVRGKKELVDRPVRLLAHAKGRPRARLAVPSEDAGEQVDGGLRARAVDSDGRPGESV